MELILHSLIIAHLFPVVFGVAVVRNERGTNLVQICHLLLEEFELGLRLFKFLDAHPSHADPAVENVGDHRVQDVQLDHQLLLARRLHDLVVAHCVDVLLDAS